MTDIEYELANIEHAVRHKCVKLFLDLIVLSSLRSREMSGYDVMIAVYDKFRVLLSPGTIYPVLDTLRQKDLIEVKLTRRKKIYTLTDKGVSYTSLLSEEYGKFYSQIMYMH